MFIFLLALGEDYNILIMTRIREEAKELPLDQAITRALAATGTTVTSAGLVLAGTFGVLAVVGSRSGGSDQLVVIGVALSAGILMDSFLVRTLLVPSVVALLGGWNWWPSSMARADHQAAPRCRWRPLSRPPDLAVPEPVAGGRQPWLAVIGASQVPAELAQVAHEVGEAIAVAGAVLVCGGLGGVMEAACRGARCAGGLTVGLLPGEERSSANQWVDVAIPTGLGEARNALVVRAADALVAVGGEYGTLSEIALALKAGKPVVGLATWQLTRGDGVPDEGIVLTGSAGDAVGTALRLAGWAGPRRSVTDRPHI